MLHYDNLEDTKAKLEGTICMYDGEAVRVQEIGLADADGKLPYTVYLKCKGGKGRNISLDDPKFEFRNFNLGYANQGTVAYWWYRRPLKQYRQGLRSDQMASLYAKPDWYGHQRWDYNNSIISMLENAYPSLETCEKSLKDEQSHCRAFNRDFSVSYDRIHRDLLIEHRGKIIGQTSNFKAFHLLEEFKHLTEAVQEAIG